MEDKKVKSGNLVIGICLFVIAVLLAAVYNANIEKNNLQTQISELETKLEEKNENDDKNEMVSFSKLMDMIYPKEFEANLKKYKPAFGGEMDFMITRDVSENIINVQGYSVGYHQAENEESSIDIYIFNQENNIDKNYTVSGIDEEIVSILVTSFESESVPNYIYFLTREGNVYYLYNNNSIEMINLKATKIENISNVIAINVASVIDDNAMHTYSEVVASTYDGEYKTLNEYINN